MDLLATEVRVLGSLLEKQHTTPDAYPLTLNSLRLACNQSTNRDPVVEYAEAEVRDALQRLERRGMVRFASGAGSRAAKFRHLLSERLPMPQSEQAVMCVLMLRGAQTPGELKQRADRLHLFAGLPEVQQTLQALIDRGLVQRVERRPGQKEERYVHLLSAEREETGERPARERGDAGTEAGNEAPGHVRERSAHAEPSGQQREPLAYPQPPARAEQPASPDGELRDLRERVSRLERDLAGLKAELGVGRDG
jgi:uncharacterized protein YceH (UPF0502 family)